MSSPPQPTEVSLNDRVTAVATVYSDGQLQIMQRDPLIAALAPSAPDQRPVFLYCFPFEAVDTMIVEIWTPIARQVPTAPQVDAWAVRKANDLFNVYVVREETHDDGLGSMFKAQSSLVATNLSVPAFALAVEVLIRTADQLAIEFRQLCGPSGPAAGSAPIGRLETPADAVLIGPHATGDHCPSGHVSAMPGCL
jgi:hypothetical protein